jgi:hypothetical protein
MNMTQNLLQTHSVWIGSKLGLMEKLTLKLLLAVGHSPILWTIGDLEGVPDNVEVRQVPSHYLQPVRFAGIPLETIPRGGIGSFAHWSDYFAFKTLHEHGGIWVQMDVAVTKKIPAINYAFSPLQNYFSPVVMSIPKGSVYAGNMANLLEAMLVDGMKGRHWNDAMIAIVKEAIQHKVKICIFKEYFDCGGIPTSPYNCPSPVSYAMIHWSNATHNSSKETPVVGSEYHRLCLAAGLLKLPV